jgi:phospho-N-acetylmuramoyl-pentapeptide-transferase
MIDFKEVLFPLVITFVFTMLVAPLFIPFLKRLKFGQQIRTDGPQSHLKKTGTPTMGGIIILLAIALASLKFIDKNSELIVLLVATLGFGLIGFLDDYIKIVFKRSLGLTARQKLVGQLIVSAIVCYYLVKMGHSTDLHVPFFDWSIQLGWLYFPFIALMMMGTTNAVNITDGLDGLLAGTSAIAFGGFVIVAMKGHSPEAAIFSAAMIGAVLGFLVFNAHPAKVFMGDTGSLGIGGGLAAVAILTKEEILLAVIGGVFVFEILSVIIQVISFKTRRKRVFKMSPIHHHFELVGWSEWRVVTTFWFVGILLAVLGLYLNGVF